MPTEPSDSPFTSPESYDVAVIGGGISGVYTAWKLRSARPDQLSDTDDGHMPSLRKRAFASGGRLKVGLLECSHRIGGRLFSRALPVSSKLPPSEPAAPEVPHSVVELGGMRYIKSQHRRVDALVCEYGLTPTDLRTDDERGTNLYYLRGRHFSVSDWARPEFVPPYILDRGERGRSPGSLMIEVALRHAARLQADPAPYRQIGFWNLLFDELSGEAYQLVRDAGGYDTIVGNWNAADAIPFLLADFHLKPGEQYQKLDEGFMALPVAIEKRFRAQGGITRMGHRLQRIDFDSSTRELLLAFDVDKPSWFHRPRQIPKGTEKLVTAGHVVLAMPRRSLELLHPDSVIFSETDEGKSFHDALRAVLPQPGFKIFAAYKSPWWRDTRQIAKGRSLTDLPVRQCYAWRTAQAGASNQASILMASYNDGASVEFWKGLARRRGRYTPPATAYPPGIAIPTTDPDGIIAPSALVSELHDQLRELHGLTEVIGPDVNSILPPYYAVYKDWTGDPFGGGWHFWDAGVDSRRIMRAMQKPFDDLPLHVCGEAWSSQQGWVEGALETADEVLKYFFVANSQ